MSNQVEEMVKAISRLTAESKQVTISNSEKSLINKSDKAGYILTNEDSDSLISALDKREANKGKLKWKYGERCSTYCQSILEGEKPFNANYLLKIGQMDFHKETIIRTSEKRELIENVQDTLSSWDNGADLHIINPFIAYALTKRNATGKKVLSKKERILFVRYFKQNWSFTMLKKADLSKNPSQSIQRIANKLHRTPNSLLYQNGAMLPVTPDMVYAQCEPGIIRKSINDLPSEPKIINKTGYKVSIEHPIDRPYEYRISPLSAPSPQQTVTRSLQPPLTHKRILELRYRDATPIIREESNVQNAFITRPIERSVDKQMKRRSIANKVYSRAISQGDYRRLAYWRSLCGTITQADQWNEARVASAS